MCHLNALPGDPQFDSKSGVKAIIEWARKDLMALLYGEGFHLSNGELKGPLYDCEMLMIFQHTRDQGLMDF